MHYLFGDIGSPQLKIRDVHPRAQEVCTRRYIHLMSIDRKDRNLMKHSFQFRKAHHSAGLAILASREKDRKEKVGEQKVAEVVRAKL